MDETAQKRLALLNEQKESNMNEQKELTKKAIAVMSAWVAGKKIECKKMYGSYQTLDNKWYETGVPSWDWNDYDYRIKEEPVYEAYTNAKEFLEAQKEHGPYVKGCGQYLLPIFINDINENGVVLGSIYPTFHTYKDLLDHYKWQDGTVCGILKSEE